MGSRGDDVQMTISLMVFRRPIQRVSPFALLKRKGSDGDELEVRLAIEKTQSKNAISPMEYV